MTVETSHLASGPYLGDGSTTLFQRTFAIYTDQDVVVTVDGHRRTAGVRILAPEQAEGDVEIIPAPEEGAVIWLTRHTIINQQTNYTSQSAVSPEQIESDLDKGILIAQEQQDALDRSLKVAVGQQGLTVQRLPQGIIHADAHGNLVDGGTVSGAQSAAQQS